jgi:hydroxyacid-oxoacid transhydrogenase
LEAAEIFGADITNAHKEDAGRILSDALRKFLEGLDVPNGIGALGFKKSDVGALVEGTLPQVRFEHILEILHFFFMVFW